MKPVIQTKLHNPPHQNGNCLNAVLSSLLEIPIDNIPNFEDMSQKKWFFALLDWLKEKGFHLLQWDEEIYLPGYFIANGPSPRGFEHSVIYKGTKMVHDPYPCEAGLTKITSVWALLPLDPVCNKCRETWIR